MKKLQPRLQSIRVETKFGPATVDCIIVEVPAFGQDERSILALVDKIVLDDEKVDRSDIAQRNAILVSAHRVAKEYFYDELGRLTGRHNQPVDTEALHVKEASLRISTKSPDVTGKMVNLMYACTRLKIKAHQTHHIVCPDMLFINGIAAHESKEYDEEIRRDLYYSGFTAIAEHSLDSLYAEVESALLSVRPGYSPVVPNGDPFISKSKAA